MNVDLMEDVAVVSRVGRADSGTGKESRERNEMAYRDAERKARLWDSIGQLKEAARNGIIRPERVAELSGVKRQR